MPDNRHFLRSTNIADKIPALIDDDPAVLTYRDLIGRVEAISTVAATLFAEPILPRNVEKLGAAISWYCCFDGPAIEITSMDEAARKPVLAKLSTRLAALAPALNDPNLGPALSTWLNVGSPSSLLSVGGEPVLIDWGFLPGGSDGSSAAADAYFATTLGRFAPSLATPPARVLSAPATTPSPVAPRVEPGRQEHRVPPAPSIEAPSRPWLAPAVASTIAAVGLLVLLLPGVLIYADHGSSNARDSLETQILRDSNASLEAQIKAIEAAAGTAACRRPERFVPVPGMLPSPSPDGPMHGPDGTDANPGQPSTAQPGSDQPGPHAPKPEPRMEVLPPPPEKVEIPRPTDPAHPGQASTRSVADLLDGATVLIFSAIAGKNMASQGSGFFISETQIVTNRHVIEGADPNLIFVTNSKLGDIRRAKIVTKSDATPSGKDVVVDLAVIEIAPVPGQPFLKIGTTPAKLSTAYVAGFPGFITEHDNNYQTFLDRLRASVSSSDLDAALRAPGLVAPSSDLRTGRVNNVITVGRNDVKVLVHDMQLAHGNSGGPLVDACGRLGGVNSLLFPSEDKSQQANIAQDVSIVRTFLEARSIPFEHEETACDPSATESPSSPTAPNTAPVNPTPGQPPATVPRTTAPANTPSP